MHRLLPSNGENESRPTSADTSQATHCFDGELCSGAEQPGSVPLRHKRHFDRLPAHKQARNQQCEQPCDWQSEQLEAVWPCRPAAEQPWHRQARLDRYMTEQPRSELLRGGQFQREQPARGQLRAGQFGRKPFRSEQPWRPSQRTEHLQYEMPLKEQPVNEHSRRIPSRLDYCRREQHTTDAAVTACHVTPCTAYATVTAYQVDAFTALACTAAATITRIEVGDSVKISDHFVSKNVLVDLTVDDCPDQTLRVYALFNKQPDSTSINDSALEFFGQQPPTMTHNTIHADPSNITSKIGRQVSGVKVKGVLNNNIIPASYANQFPPFHSNAQLSLLIRINNKEGLDTRVLVLCVYPLLHCKSLGCTHVGDASTPADAEIPVSVVARLMLTRVKLCSITNIDTCQSATVPAPVLVNDQLEQIPDDECIGTLHEDKLILNIMQENIAVLLNCSLQILLSFKTNFKLTDNRSSILITSKNTINNVYKDPDKIKKCQLAMQKNIDN